MRQSNSETVSYGRLGGVGVGVRVMEGRKEGRSKAMEGRKDGWKDGWIGMDRRGMNREGQD